MSQQGHKRILFKGYEGDGNGKRENKVAEAAEEKDLEEKVWGKLLQRERELSIPMR